MSHLTEVIRHTYDQSGSWVTVLQDERVQAAILSDDDNVSLSRKARAALLASLVELASTEKRKTVTGTRSATAKGDPPDAKRRKREEDGEEGDNDAEMDEEESEEEESNGEVIPPPYEMRPLILEPTVVPLSTPACDVRWFRYPLVTNKQLWTIAEAENARVPDFPFAQLTLPHARVDGEEGSVPFVDLNAVNASSEHDMGTVATSRGDTDAELGLLSQLPMELVLVLLRRMPTLGRKTRNLLPLANRQLHNIWNATSNYAHVATWNGISLKDDKLSLPSSYHMFLLSFFTWIQLVFMRTVFLDNNDLGIEPSWPDFSVHWIHEQAMFENQPSLKNWLRLIKPRAFDATTAENLLAPNANIPKYNDDLSEILNTDDEDYTKSLVDYITFRARFLDYTSPLHLYKLSTRQEDTGRTNYYFSNRMMSDLPFRGNLFGHFMVAVSGYTPQLEEWPNGWTHDKVMQHIAATHSHISEELIEIVFRRQYALIEADLLVSKLMSDCLQQIRDELGHEFVVALASAMQINIASLPIGNERIGVEEMTSEYSADWLIKQVGFIDSANRVPHPNGAIFDPYFQTRDLTNYSPLAEAIDETTALDKKIWVVSRDRPLMIDTIHVPGHFIVHPKNPNTPIYNDDIHADSPDVAVSWVLDMIKLEAVLIDWGLRNEQRDVQQTLHRGVALLAKYIAPEMVQFPEYATFVT